MLDTASTTLGPGDILGEHCGIQILVIAGLGIINSPLVQVEFLKMLEKQANMHFQQF